MVIEREILNYLSENLTVPVYMYRPESNPNPGMLSFVIVQKTGGSMTDGMIRHATIAIQTYAPTAEEAAELMEDVITVMWNMDRHDIPQADLESGPVPFPLTTTKQPRYQAVYAITHY